MTIPPPSGIPYHRLARTAAHRWWRFPLGTLFIVAVVFAAMIAFVIFTEIFGRPGGPDGMATLGALPDLALGFLSIAVALPVTMVAALWIQRRAPGTLSSVAGRIRWRWLAVCLGVATVTIILFLGGITGLSVLTGEDAGLDDPLAGWGPFLVSAAVLLAVVPFQAAAEEYLCRGWLLQGLGAWLRGPWLPILVQAAVFAALHGWGTPWGFADLMLFGAVAGWVTVRTGGLEAAVALHVMNNLLSTLVAAAFGQLAIDETAADMPWQGFAVDVPILIGFAAVIIWLAGRRRLPAATPIVVYPTVAYGPWRPAHAEDGAAAGIR
ncbi:type II CAAX endopeptidase family protein [Actinoplanes sp. NPDC026670]|uniref:CPBP family intramembrane glutamic endopeptidase n=1 Tax=Actinoplanes sp. NPDC026670 TaxID=3154700 RepID=UPI00340B4244